jgi:hypothetical protein
MNYSLVIGNSIKQKKKKKNLERKISWVTISHLRQQHMLNTSGNNIQLNKGWP